MYSANGAAVRSSTTARRSWAARRRRRSRPRRGAAVARRQTGPAVSRTEPEGAAADPDHLEAGRRLHHARGTPRAPPRLHGRAARRTIRSGQRDPRAQPQQRDRNASAMPTGTRAGPPRSLPAGRIRRPAPGTADLSATGWRSGRTGRAWQGFQPSALRARSAGRRCCCAVGDERRAQRAWPPAHPRAAAATRTAARSCSVEDSRRAIRSSTPPPPGPRCFSVWMSLPLSAGPMPRPCCWPIRTACDAAIHEG